MIYGPVLNTSFNKNLRFMTQNQGKTKQSSMNEIKGQNRIKNVPLKLHNEAGEELSDFPQD